MKRIAIPSLCAIGLLGVAAFAQAPGGPQTQEDNGFLINLLQNQLSAPGREIQLAGVSGALSSQARIASVTISDDEGPWLVIENVELNWSRAQLLLGRVNVNRLGAERVTWIRQGASPESETVAPEAEEAQPFTLPELPVSLTVGELDFPSISFGEPVFGEAAEIALSGAISLVGGALDATLDIERSDAPGGTLGLAAAFSNATRELSIDLDLQEPQGGFLSRVLAIEGEPAIDLRVTGAGPLENVDIDFTLDAGGDRIAGGQLALREESDGLGFRADLAGGLAPLIPAQYRDFFGGTTTIHAAGVSRSEGGFRVDALSIDGAALRLDGDLEIGADNFPRSLNLSGSLGTPEGPAIVLPVPGGTTEIHSAVLHVNFGGASRWSGYIVLDRLVADDIEIEDMTLRLGGLSRSLDDPATRLVTLDLEGVATGIRAEDPDVSLALATRIDFFADAAFPANGPVSIRQLQLSGNGLSIFTAGTVEDFVYTGRNRIQIDDVSPFSGLAGRTLGGAVNLRADGSVSPLSGGFDLAVAGTTDNIAIGDPRIDGLLAGETVLSGRAVRDETGIRSENLLVRNPQLEISSDGFLSSARTDIGFEARLADLAIVEPRASGALMIVGRAEGDGGPINIALEAAIPDGRLIERDLDDLRLRFAGAVDGREVAGRFEGTGALDGLAIDGSADIESTAEANFLRNLVFSVGSNRLTGEIAQVGAAPVTGELSLRAPQIAPLAALALVEAEGALDADITLGPAAVGQGLSLRAALRGLAMEGASIDALDLDASIVDALGVPMVDGTVSAQGLNAGGVSVSTLSANSERIEDARMRFGAEALLAIGTAIEMGGELSRIEDGFAATLSELSLRQADTAATLVSPSTISIRGGAIELTPLELDLGAGRLVAEGRVDEELDLTLDIDALPLSIANLVQPTLGLAGQVNGSAEVTGSRTAPNVEFDLAASGLSSAVSQAAGLPPLSLAATGVTHAGQLALDAQVTATNGLSAAARGSLPLGEGAIDLAVDIQNFQLVLIDRLAGGQGLAGSVTGQANVAGTLSEPTASFALRGSGLSANVLRENGVAPLAVAADGAFAANVVQLGLLEASNPQGLNLSGSGQIPLTGPGLNATISGSVPLALANALLAERDAQAVGTIQLNAAATGSLAAPNLSGAAQMSGGTLVDPQTNIRLEDVTIDVGLQGNSIAIRNASAQVSSGGGIAASGSVGLTPGFPADMDAQIQNVRYTDGSFVTTRISGALSVNGPLVGSGGLISGRIDLGATEISIAEGLGVNVSSTLEQVTHVRPSPRVLQTLDRARVTQQSQPASPAGPGGPALDVLISAPNQIFVRGRGLDVELGGELIVRGPINNIAPVGQFDLIRGRLSVLGQRIQFDEGSLQLMGNLDPHVNFVASTQSDDVTAIVTVSGRVSEPQITFSSNPELPQDEVLARVIFNRSAENLSAFQLAQLAAAAAELAGRGGNGFLSRLRSAAGLDDLDIITEDDGSTAVRAGRYIDDNIYLDVQTSTEGTSRIQINLDVSDRVTARGAVATDGNTSLGIFYERDY